MTISGQPAASLLDSIANAGRARTDANVSVLKKALEVEQQQGEALINMLEKSGVSPDGRLDSYA